MIFVVILIAAATTIIAASVDLGRMANYKQKQAERDAKWQYCVESSKALVVEDLVDLVGTTQSFANTINGVNLTVTSAVDNSWNPLTGVNITTTGVIDGKTRSTHQYVGKRATVQPCQFGMFFTTKFQPSSTVTLTGDLYVPTINVDTSQLTLVGDIYSSSTTATSLVSQTGSFFGRQPGQSIILNDAAYAAQATVTTSGTTTLNNITNPSSGTHSQLRYHTGALTISGTITGEVTIYVKGSVNINVVKNVPAGIARLVVICNGDVQFQNGTSDVFVICNGTISTATSGGGGGGGSSQIINGSLAGSQFTNVGGPMVVTFNNYFVANPDGGNRYWIPGQW